MTPLPEWHPPPCPTPPPCPAAPQGGPCRPHFTDEERGSQRTPRGSCMGGGQGFPSGGAEREGGGRKGPSWQMKPSLYPSLTCPGLSFPSPCVVRDQSHTCGCILKRVLRAWGPVFEVCSAADSHWPQFAHLPNGEKSPCSQVGLLQAGSLHHGSSLLQSFQPTAPLSSLPAVFPGKRAERPPAPSRPRRAGNPPALPT